MTARAGFVIGSRGSALAMWQSELVRTLLGTATGLPVSIRRIRTTGDKIADVPLAKVGAKGLFVKEIEVALAAGEVDLAVHSMKDVPTALPDGLEIAATTERADARDVLVSTGHKGLSGLPPHARIGTSSLRRRAQLAALRPDLRIVDLRGNLDTRLGKVRHGDLDAVILAAAGIDRLGLSDAISERLDVGVMVPAVGQGAIAIEIRSDDEEVRRALALFAHEATLACVKAERVVMRELEGGCQVPIGAHARYVGPDQMHIDAMVASLDGSTLLRTSLVGPAADPEALGRRAVEDLLAQGAGDVLEAVRAEAEAALAAVVSDARPRWEGPRAAPRAGGRRLAGRRVVITRSRTQAAELLRLLEEEGAEVLESPTIRFEEPDDWAQADAAIGALDEYDWVVFTSANGVSRFVARLAVRGVDSEALSKARIAAVGPATARALERAGLKADLIPNAFIAESLTEAMGATVAGARVLIPRAQVAREVLPEELTKAGALVDVVPVYRTVSEAGVPDAVRRALDERAVDAITFTSASTVRELASLLAPRPLPEVLAGVVVACIGPVTAEKARAEGLEVGVVPDRSTVPDLVDALAGYLGPAEGS